MSALCGIIPARIAVGRCGSAAGSFAVAALLTGIAVGRCAAGLLPVLSAALSGLSALSGLR